jgi:hypothetical protein
MHQKLILQENPTSVRLLTTAVLAVAGIDTHSCCSYARTATTAAQAGAQVLCHSVVSSPPCLMVSQHTINSHNTLLLGQTASFAGKVSSMLLVLSKPVAAADRHTAMQSLLGWHCLDGLYDLVHAVL